jgi:hypothetical protein
MNKKALEYLLQQQPYLNDKFKIYYDFDSGSVFSTLSGGYYYGVISNNYPSTDTGKCHGIIYDTFDASEALAINKSTGIFLQKNGSGDLAYSNILISGSPDLNFNNCTCLFNFSNYNYSGSSILLGGFKKTSEIVGGQEYIGSSGFNFGINERGQLFFQSLGVDGEYILTANSIELSKKNLIALTIGYNVVSISRYDLINKKIQNEDFSITTEYIKNPQTAYIGFSELNYEGLTNLNQKSFSGYISNVAILSGNLNKTLLKEVFETALGASYYETSGSIDTTTTLTGYTQSFAYNTGITGYAEIITGYVYLQSGYSLVSGGYQIVSSGVVLESELSQFLNSGSCYLYLTSSGYLEAGINYLPTGFNAEATLGLQNNFQTGYFYSGITGYITGVYLSPVYGSTGLTGYTTEITGVNQVPLYSTGYVTGAGTSGTLFSGDFSEFRKDFIYYLGERIL